MRIKRIPRALAHSYAPTLVTKPTETTPNAEAVPGCPGADRHALPIEPAQWPPSPTIHEDAGFSLDARRGRDRIT